MRAYRKLLATILVFSFFFIITACEGKEEKVAMRSYIHKDQGFSLQIPADWNKVKEDDDSAIFRSYQPSITLYVYEELGGISIYSADEVAKMTFDEFKKNMKSAKILRESFSYSMDKAYRLIFQGNIEGHDYTGMLFVREQDFGIRHYLIFLTPSKIFYEYEPLFEAIARNFKLKKDDLQYYQKLSPHYKKSDNKKGSTVDQSK